MLRFQDIYKNQRSTILFSLKESSINQLLSIGITLKSVWKNANSPDHVFPPMLFLFGSTGLVQCI